MDILFHSDLIEHANKKIKKNNLNTLYDVNYISLIALFRNNFNEICIPQSIHTIGFKPIFYLIMNNRFEFSTRTNKVSKTRLRFLKYK